MKKYFILLLLPLAFWGCEKNKIWINDFTFYIDGKYYDLSCIDENGGKWGGTSEICVFGWRYDKNSPLLYLEYFFMGYNATSGNGAYGGTLIDRSVKKETVFEVPNRSKESYFWIEINKVVYDAISGYIQMINETALETEEDINNAYGYDYTNKLHGTFEFVMVNRYDESDTIHVTNGKFRYQRYGYMENYQVY